MPATGVYIRKISAAVLLALFAFILAEKSAHGHSKMSRPEHDRHTAVHSSYNCLICDFQLGADADLPVGTSLPVQLVFAAPNTIHSSQDFFVRIVFQHAERGPPASSIA